MQKRAALTALIAFLVPGVLVHAEERASKKEAVAMVKKAVAHYKKSGDKAFADFTAPSKAFVEKDLYVVAYDSTGKCVAHGQNAKQAGKDLIGLKDPDGKAFVKERVDLAKTKESFWQDYKFTDPLTKKVLPKEAYCEKGDDKLIICAGVYRE